MVNFCFYFSLSKYLSFSFVGVISVDALTDTLDLFSTIKRLIRLTCSTVVSAWKPSLIIWNSRATPRWPVTAAQIVERPFASFHTCRATWRFTARDSLITAVFASRTSPTWPALSSTRRFTIACKNSPVISKTFRCRRVWIGTLDLTNNWVSPKWIQSLAKCTKASLTRKISKRVVTHLIKRRRAMCVSTAGVHIGMLDPCSTTKTATKRAPFSAQCVKRSSPTWWHWKTTGEFTQSPSAISAWNAARRSACLPSSSATDAFILKRSLSPAFSVISASPASPTCDTTRSCTRMPSSPLSPPSTWIQMPSWDWVWSLSSEAASAGPTLSSRRSKGRRQNNVSVMELFPHPRPNANNRNTSGFSAVFVKMVSKPDAVLGSSCLLYCCIFKYFSLKDT